MNGWSLSNENPSVLRVSRENDADFGIPGYGGIRPDAIFTGVVCHSGELSGRAFAPPAGASLEDPGGAFEYAEIVIKFDYPAQDGWRPRFYDCRHENP
jgi:hypothetical protein